MRYTAGLDFGGVLCDKWCPPYEKALRFLNDYRSYVCLISKASPAKQEQILQYLEQWDLEVEAVFFVRNHMDKEPVIRALEIEIYVDDRLDVLRSLTTVRKKIWVDRGHWRDDPASRILANASL